MLVPQGDITRMLDGLREAEALACEIGDQHRLGRALYHLADQFRIAGDYERSVEYGARALIQAERVGDHGLQAQVQFYRGLALLALGDYRAARDCFRWVVEALAAEWLDYRAGAGGGRPAVTSRSTLGACLGELGEFEEAALHLADAVRLAEAGGRAWDIISAYWRLGHVEIIRGDYGKAVPALERSLAICETADVKYLLPTVAALLGYAYACSGRVTDGLRQLAQASEAAQIIRYGTFQALNLVWFGEVYLLTSRQEDARRLASEALTMARGRKERGHEAWTLRLVGEIAAQADPPDVEQAESYYQQALVLAEELGMRPVAAHCHLGLGTLCQKIGRDEGAQAELATAAEMYRAMEMTFWLEKAEAALARSGAA